MRSNGNSVHSRLLTRGSVGDKIDARTREGRFLRHTEAELVKHVGGAPSFIQKVLITRASRAMLRLQLLDEKLSNGGLSDHDGRIYGALGNSLRLTLRELGMKAAAAEKAASLDEILARHEAAP
jgi:hypothetical protein